MAGRPLISAVQAQPAAVAQSLSFAWQEIWHSPGTQRPEADAVGLGGPGLDPRKHDGQLVVVDALCDARTAAYAQCDFFERQLVGVLDLDLDAELVTDERRELRGDPAADLEVLALTGVLFGARWRETQGAQQQGSADQDCGLTLVHALSLGTPRHGRGPCASREILLRGSQSPRCDGEDNGKAGAQEVWRNRVTHGGAGRAPAVRHGPHLVSCLERERVDPGGPARWPPDEEGALDHARRGCPGLTAIMNGCSWERPLTLG